jgi:hypothetical protein
MWKNRCFLGCVLLMFLVLTCYSAHAAGTEGIPVGTALPAFKMNAPADKADQEYLGLKGSEPFTLSQVSGRLVLVEFLSVL